MGIGATATVFSAVNAVLLRPLPYPNADRIAMIVRSQDRGAGDSQDAVTFRFIRQSQRSFGREEEDPGAAPVAVLSHALWQNTFGGRSDIVGQRLELMGQPYAIAGVMPATFQPFLPVDVWTPLKSNDPRGVGTNYSVIGHLKDGITIQQADAKWPP